MDRELAEAVLWHWENGHPVSEAKFYKAAAVLGANPVEALVEARFYTALDSFLLEKRAMSELERIVFSAAAGFPVDTMEKTAAAHGFAPDELILEALRENDWVPNLEKLALLAPPQQDPTMMTGGGAGGQGGPEQGPAPAEGASPDAMMAPPQQGAAVQQQPAARFKPSPTAPDQAAPSQDGNLEALLAESQGQFGQQAQENGGLPPAGADTPPPAPPPSPDRVKQVAPDLDDETAQRYGEQLDRLEQAINMQVMDPKQMVKFVKELQKVDGKKIDQGIKAMGEALEQEQAQELGVGQPTVNGTNPSLKLPPKGGQPGAEQGGDAGGAGPSEEELAAAAGGGQGGPPQQPPKGQAGPPQKKPSQPGGLPPQMQQAAEKVAHAARAVARSHR